MLWFFHPKPAGARKPVAMLVQRKAEPTATQGAANRAGNLPSMHENVASTPRAAINFSVRYNLMEYAGFMWEHGGYLIRRRRIGFLRTYLMLLKSTAGAALNFLAQSRAKVVYDFTIDDHGLIRSSARGVTLIGWDDVIRVRRYRRGYLMVLKRGTLPIPYRCLGTEQAQGIAHYADMLKAAAQR